MTRTEHAAAIAAATEKYLAVRAIWEAARDAGQTDLRCPEYQAVNVAQAALSALHRIIPTETQDRMIAGDRAVRIGRAEDRCDNADMYA